MHVLFIVNGRTGVTLTRPSNHVRNSSDSGRCSWGEILTHSGWYLTAWAGFRDGSVSRLVQLSSRRETIYTGCLGNAEKRRTLKKYGNS